MAEMNREIRENLNEFVRDLAELTARTGIKVGDLLPGVGGYLDTAVGGHTVAKNLHYNADEGVYEYEDVVNLEPEVQEYYPDTHNTIVGSVSPGASVVQARTVTGGINLRD